MQNACGDLKVKKRSLIEISVLERYGNDVAQYFQCKNHKFWISSDWFSYFLKFLSLRDIAILDSAFCNHEDRIQWLISITNHSVPCLNIRSMEAGKDFMNWLILKKICSEELKFTLHSTNDVPPTMIRIINNCPHLRKLELSNEYRFIPTRMISFSEVLSHTLSRYNNLEILKIEHVGICESDFESLSNICHQLKVIHLLDINVTGLEKLLMTNRHLLDLKIASHNIRVGYTFEILGQYCPLLQKCHVWCCHGSEYNVTNNNQIETFTKGCQHLKYLNFGISDINMTPITVFDKLLLYLGKYNLLLEDLRLFDYEEQITLVASESLKILSIGCPNLRLLHISGIKIPAQGVCHVINNMNRLDEVAFLNCKLCEDGSIISHVNDKLKSFKHLNLSLNPYLDDESFVNLIKGCHNLECLKFTDCDDLTDDSLFNIAANCPSLKDIYLDLDNFSYLGIIELETKCPKLLYKLDDKNLYGNYDDDDSSLIILAGGYY